MAHIKLTGRFCIDPEVVAVIKNTDRYGGCVEIVLKRGCADYNDSDEILVGEDGVEAWANWNAYMHQSEA